MFFGMIVVVVVKCVIIKFVLSCKLKNNDMKSRIFGKCIGKTLVLSNISYSNGKLIVPLNNRSEFSAAAMSESCKSLKIIVLK